jgi:hypothetical protein
VTPSTAFRAAYADPSTDETATGRPLESRTSLEASAVIETSNGTEVTATTAAPSAIDLLRFRMALTGRIYGSDRHRTGDSENCSGPTEQRGVTASGRR